MSTKYKTEELSQVRIIGGRWRSRQLNFPAVLGLRPTPNRIRETLFNWLSPIIVGAHCLDLFAGSGALGFEALSRGADYCLFLDNNLQVIKYLNAASQTFHCNNLQIIQAQFPYPYGIITKQFNIVFIDPPFHQGLVAEAIHWLIKCNCLADRTLIYIESEPELDNLPIPEDWQLLRDKKAGNVRYRLLARNELL